MFAPRLKPARRQASLLTDAMLAADAVDIVDVDGITDVGTMYMIATLNDASHPDVAQAFIDAVMSDAGQDIMGTYGFGNN